MERLEGAGCKIGLREASKGNAGTPSDFRANFRRVTTKGVARAPYDIQRLGLSF